MELTTLANNQGKAFQATKESFSNIDNSTNLNILKQYQGELSDSLVTSSAIQLEGGSISSSVEPVSQSFGDSYDSLLQRLESEENERNTVVQNYLYTVTPDNKYLGQNVQFSNSSGYITAQGVYKKYGTDGVVFNTTAGKNSCPADPIIYPIQNATIPDDTDVGSISQNAQYTFVVGTPMQSNQSCGNEGKNVFVSTVNTNPSSTLLGSYMDSIESPTMSFLNNGSSSFTYDTCLQAAVNNGYTYFALQSANPTDAGSEQFVQCTVTNDGDSAMRLGRAQTSCQQASDSYVYGGPNSIALYATPTARYVGTFQDNPSRAMTFVNNGSQSFSTEQCYNYALSNGYTFFGVQNGSNPSNAQCFVSNDYAQTTEYGESSSRRYSTIDRTIYGGGWANAVYEITGAADNLGCYANSTTSPPMTTLSQNSDFENCQSVAQSNGYKFFGLGGGGPGEATCYGSQNSTEAKQYGTYTPNVKLPDGNLYGTTSVNTIYKVVGEMFAENLGQVGYVTEDTTLLPYPDNLVSTTTGTEYALIPNMIEPASLTPTITSSSMSECQDACDESTDCGGYYFDSSNTCSLQPTNFLQQSQSTPSPTLLTADAYIKIPSVTNSASCSKDVVSIDSELWQNYPQNGEQMTDSQPCGLAAVTQPETDMIGDTSDTLNSMFSGMSDFHTVYNTYLEGFTGIGGGLFGKISDNSQKIQDTAFFLEQIESTKANELPPQLVNVSGISVLEKYTNYNSFFMMGIFLLLVAIVAFITTSAF